MYTVMAEEAQELLSENVRRGRQCPSSREARAKPVGRQAEESSAQQHHVITWRGGPRSEARSRPKATAICCSENRGRAMCCCTGREMRMCCCFRKSRVCDSTSMCCCDMYCRPNCDIPNTPFSDAVFGYVSFKWTTALNKKQLSSFWLLLPWSQRPIAKIVWKKVKYSLILA